MYGSSSHVELFIESCCRDLQLTMTKKIKINHKQMEDFSSPVYVNFTIRHSKFIICNIAN